MKRFNKLIAVLTAVAMLMSALCINSYAENAPSAVPKSIIADGAVLRGDYTYNGDDEGSSVYQWYVSDSFFDKGSPIEGANKREFVPGSATYGKFISFGVTPVDKNNNRGEEVFSTPVMQNDGYYSDFSGSAGAEISAQASKNGFAGIVKAPDSDEKVLGVSKPANDSYKSEVRVNIGEFSSAKDAIDLDIYASDISGTADIFGVYDDTYGLVFKLFLQQTQLYYQGGSGKQKAECDFKSNEWNHLSLKINCVEHTLSAQLNNQNVFGDSKEAEAWRYINDSFNNVAISFMNYGNGGKVYIKNLVAIKANGDELAQADADWLVSALPAVAESDVELPSMGQKGSRIFYKTDSKYIDENGKVNRPPYLGDKTADAENQILHAYIVNGTKVIEKDISITIKAMPEPPQALDVSVVQNNTRYVTGTYEFYDPDFIDEGDSIYNWYVEDGGSYKQIVDEHDKRFVPTEGYDGKNIKFGVIPVNKNGVRGNEELSEPFNYQWRDRTMPTAKITSTAVNETGFEATYSYSSNDYKNEGHTVIKWYCSTRYDGNYEPADNSTNKYIDPETGEVKYMLESPSNNKYYKFGVTPVDPEGNVGEEVLSDPMVFCDYSKDSATIISDAVSAIELPTDVYNNLELQTCAENLLITWISDNAAIGNDGIVDRPSKDDSDISVTLTAYFTSGTVTKIHKFKLTVKKFSQAPVVGNVAINQDGRSMTVNYEYSDEDGDTESGTYYKWYSKALGAEKFELINDADSFRFTPDSSMDGYTFKVAVTPCDSTVTYGNEVISPEYVYNYVPAVAPSAQPNRPSFGLSKLVADYSYFSKDGIDEGNSEFSWYVSDDLFGQYTLIDGEKTSEYKCSDKDEWKFFKYTVIPIDKEGLKGEPVTSEATQFRYGKNIDFESGDALKTYGVDDSQVYTGKVLVDVDPEDKNNHVLTIDRPKTGGWTHVLCELPSSAGGDYMTLDIDVYPSSSTKGTWEMLYIGTATPGSSVTQAYKLYCIGKTLKVRGGDVAYGGNTLQDITISNNFTNDKWHHIKVVFDYKNQKVLATYVDGELIKLPYEIPFRYKMSTITYISTYMQNTTIGKNYIDNIRVTPVISYTGYTTPDADALELEGDTSAIIRNIKLPTEGSVNGSKIIWKSSDESVISTQGKVTRPSSDQGDKKVTLTACLIYGNDYTEKTFDVNVMKILDANEIVNRDLEKISAAYADYMTDSNVSLPSKGEYGSVLSWKSSDGGVMTDDGAVTRFDTKRDVTMKVTVSYEAVNKSRDLVFTVAPNHGTDLLKNGRVLVSSQKAQYPNTNAFDGDYTSAWSSLVSDRSPFVKLDLGTSRQFNRLLIADRYRSVEKVKIQVSDNDVDWEDLAADKTLSDNISMLELPTSQARYIRMYLTTKSCGASLNEIKVFYVKTDDTKVEDGIESITLPCGTTATSDFTLTQTLSDGTSVTWTSSNSQAIAISGATAVVTRGTSDVQVTLTATVTSGGVSKQKSFVVLVPAAPGSSGVGGGSGTGGGRATSGVTSAAGSYVPSTPTEAHEGFDDITSVSWAADAINSLAKIGVVTGTAPNTFEPNRNVAREEFSAFVYRGFGFDEVSTSAQFGDVAANEWYYKCITQLASLGVISGIGNGVFGVGDSITRQDMAVIIYRAAVKAGINFNSAPCSFDDSGDIADYAEDAIGALSAAGIINGVGGNVFNPNGNATRAEAAVIISRVISMSR